MNEAGRHRTVAEIRVGAATAIKDGRRRLIKNGGAGLLNYDGLLGLELPLWNSRAAIGDVEPLGGARLVAGEVVAGKKDWSKNRVVYIHASINDGYDARAGDVETVLGIGSGE